MFQSSIAEGCTDSVLIFGVGMSGFTMFYPTLFYHITVSKPERLDTVLQIFTERSRAKKNAVGQVLEDHPI